jgi:hypothetical protein
MIPSTPKRTWIFLLVSSLAFWGPDYVVPSAWEHNATYLLISNLYQGALVLAWFWFGPAICKAMVVREVVLDPLRQAVDTALQNLEYDKARLARRPVIVAEYPEPFVLTAGLLPRQCEVYLSSGMVSQNGPDGLRFLLARALVHGTLTQRLVALLPVMALTVLFPGMPSDLTGWLVVSGFLAGWLAVHWLFELQVDRKAALAMGPDAARGLLEMLAAQGRPIVGFSLHPPLRWRLRQVSGK